MKMFVTITFALVMVGYIFFVGLQEFKDQALTSADKISSNFKQASDSLLNFQPGNAQTYFSQIKREVNLLQSQLPALTDFIPLVKNLPPIFKNLNELATTAANLSGKLDFLKKEGAQLVINQKGDELIGVLEEIKKDINQVNELSKSLKKQAVEINFDLGEEITGMNSRLYSANNFLDVFIGWLKSPNPIHIAILFQNPSEMRPAGGFIGSFANLTLDKGGLTNLEVNDIYDFDGQLDKKIIPPKALQSITTNWGARDANWFFDFPTSAQKVARLLEASKIYQERGVKFSGVIGMNVEVIKDVLRILGPIEITTSDEGGSSMTITSENFLQEVQRDVETKQNKDILKKITPLIFEKISKLTEEQKGALVKDIKYRLENKDIMIFLQDIILEGFIQDMGVGGEISMLPKDFFGEYLAVVNANVAGGKSDAFIRQDIKLSSRVTNDGEILNELIISRKHSGGDEEDEWYRKANQNFTQILTPLGSELINITGGSEKKIKPAINYKKERYKVDPDLKIIEGGEQFEKTAFSTWFNVSAGEEKELKINYKNPNKFNLYGSSTSIDYYFVFDKQSGVRGGLEFSIEAPPGFIWEETGGPYFIYKKNPPVGGPPARVVIKLKLVEL